ncbi:translation initiation factor IF-2-like [Phoca vitulina]|uniref:translation initiation factor IF-2-like n=1 Tax=Phoca vitulina TaxID=9720 RepID=UPI001395E2D1|nr:translation initiation factor IF-2-like [Phoca vitulina]
MWATAGRLPSTARALGRSNHVYALGLGRTSVEAPRISGAPRSRSHISAPHPVLPARAGPVSTRGAAGVSAQRAGHPPPAPRSLSSRGRRNTTRVLVEPPWAPPQVLSSLRLRPPPPRRPAHPNLQRVDVRRRAERAGRPRQRRRPPGIRLGCRGQIPSLVDFAGAPGGSKCKSGPPMAPTAGANVSGTHLHRRPARAHRTARRPSFSRPHAERVSRPRGSPATNLAAADYGVFRFLPNTGRWHLVFSRHCGLTWSPFLSCFGTPACDRRHVAPRGMLCPSFPGGTEH